MKMRYKMSCWQQILTILGTSSIPDSEWAVIFAAFLDSWDNPYYIQTSTVSFKWPRFYSWEKDLFVIILPPGSKHTDKDRIPGPT